MVVYMTNVAKSFNSTYIVPNYSAWGSYNAVRIKDNCSIENPEIDLSVFTADAKYCYIPAWGRYYFVTDIIILTGNVYRYVLTVDVMATYKSAIVGSTQYVKRSYSSGSLALNDPLVTHRNIMLGNLANTVTMSGYSQSGTFVLSTIGAGSSYYGGGNTLYAVSAANLSNLVTTVFNSSFYGDGTLVDDNVKTYFNPFQYITSCRWFPIDSSRFSGISENIKFGWWDSGVSGTKLTARGTGIGGSFSVPYQGGEGHENDFYNVSTEWTRHSAYFPGFGIIDIDPAFSGETIAFSIDVDFQTGSASLNCFCLGNRIAAMSSIYGIEIQLSQLSTNSDNAFTNIVGFIETASSGGLSSMLMNDESKNPITNFLGQLIGQGAGMLGKSSPVRNALSPNVATTGSNGNTYLLAVADYQVRVYTRFFIPDNLTDVLNKYGRPCEKELTLSSLSGFTLCDNVKIAAGTSTEQSMIKQYMEGGFYIE